MADAMCVFPRPGSPKINIFSFLFMNSPEHNSGNCFRIFPPVLFKSRLSKVLRIGNLELLRNRSLRLTVLLDISCSARWYR
jgi:hypothetical protein